MRRKKKTYEHVPIGTVAAEGKCVARVDERVVFIEGVAPGDVADIRITKRKKSYLEGRAVKFHELSKERTDPFCQHFGICGGCKWQHLAYEHQLRHKRQQVIDNFERIGKFPFPQVNDILPSSKTRFYRNKLEFTFSNKRWLSSEEIETSEVIRRDGLGFHLPLHFDKVVDIEYCYLQGDPSNDIRNSLKEFVLKENLGFYDISLQEGFLRNLIIRTTTTGQTMVIVQFGQDKMENINKIMDFLVESFPQITSLYYIINTKKNETFFDLPVIKAFGEAIIIENIDDFSFKIGPKSFFQTNTLQATSLYHKTRQMANLKGEEVVYDLYTGTGTIANYLAKQAKKVIGIETIKEAIDDAKINAQLNNIRNSTFIAGDIKDILNDTLFQQYGLPDVVITDPPRAGMAIEVINTLLNAAPKRIVYVSCNPATQARDLALLCTKYSIEEVQPVDMFPHTHHVENIVSLNLKEDDHD